METSALKSIGADNMLRELMGPRSDSSDAKDHMNAQIAMYGYAKLNELPNDLEKKQTLVTTNTYLLAAGIESDLLEDDRYYIDPEDIKEKSSPETERKIDNIDLN